MTKPTPLDEAFNAMQADPEKPSARLRYYEQLASGELVLLLMEEPVGEDIAPRVFPLPEGPMVLAFESLERLSDYAPEGAPYAAMPGHGLIALLSGQGVSLGVNFGVAPSANLLPPEVIEWLANVLSETPRETTDQPVEIAPPTGLPEALILGLDRALARAGGLAHSAYLARVVYESGGRGHLLAFIDPADGAEAALSRAVGQALSFSGLEAGALDVTALPASSPVAASLAKVGLRFDLPEPEAQTGPSTPGADPNSPPILR